MKRLKFYCMDIKDKHRIDSYADGIRIFTEQNSYKTENHRLKVEILNTKEDLMENEKENGILKSGIEVLKEELEISKSGFYDSSMANDLHNFLEQSQDNAINSTCSNNCSVEFKQIFNDCNMYKDVKSLLDQLDYILRFDYSYDINEGDMDYFSSESILNDVEYNHQMSVYTDMESFTENQNNSMKDTSFIDIVEQITILKNNLNDNEHFCNRLKEQYKTLQLKFKQQVQLNCELSKQNSLLQNQLIKLKVTNTRKEGIAQHETAKQTVLNETAIEYEESDDQDEKDSLLVLKNKELNSKSFDIKMENTKVYQQINDLSQQGNIYSFQNESIGCQEDVAFKKIVIEKQPKKTDKLSYNNLYSFKLIEIISRRLTLQLQQNENLDLNVQMEIEKLNKELGPEMTDIINKLNEKLNTIVLKRNDLNKLAIDQENKIKNLSDEFKIEICKLNNKHLNKENDPIEYQKHIAFKDTVIVKQQEEINRLCKNNLHLVRLIKLISMKLTFQIQQINIGINEDSNMQLDNLEVYDETMILEELDALSKELNEDSVGIIKQLDELNLQKERMINLFTGRLANETDKLKGDSTNLDEKKRKLDELHATTQIDIDILTNKVNKLERDIINLVEDKGRMNEELSAKTQIIDEVTKKVNKLESDNTHLVEERKSINEQLSICKHTMEKQQEKVYRLSNNNSHLLRLLKLITMKLTLQIQQSKVVINDNPNLQLNNSNVEDETMISEEQAILNRELNEEFMAIVILLDDLSLQRERMIKQYTEKFTKVINELQYDNKNLVEEKIIIKEELRTKIQLNGILTHEVKNLKFDNKNLVEENRNINEELMAKSQIYDVLTKKVNELESDRTKLLEEIRNINEKLSAKSQLYDTLTKKVNKLESDHTKLLEEKRIITEELSAETELNGNLRHEIINIKLDNNNLVEEKRNIIDELMAKSQIYDVLTKKVNELECDNTKLLEEKRNINEELSAKSQLNDTLTKKVNKLESDNTKLLEEKKIITEELSAKTELYDNLRHEIKNVKLDNNNLVEEKRNINEKLMMKSQLYDALTKKVNKLESDHTKLLEEKRIITEELSAETELNGNLRHEIINIKLDNNNLVEEKRNIIDELMAKSQIYDVLTKKVNELESDNTKLLEEKRNINEELSVKSQLYDALTKKVNKSESDNTKLLEEKRNINEELMAKSQICDVLTKKVNELQSYNTKILEEKRNINEELSAKSQLYDALTKKVNKLESDHTKLLEEKKIITEELSAETQLNGNLRHEIINVKLDNNNLVKEKRNISEELSAKSQLYDALTKQVNELECDNTKLLEEKRNINEELSAKSQLYEALTKKVKKSESDNTKLLEEKRNINEELRVKSQIYDVLANKVNKLESDNAKLLVEKRIISEELSAKTQLNNNPIHEEKTNVMNKILKHVANIIENVFQLKLLTEKVNDSDIQTNENQQPLIDIDHFNIEEAEKVLASKNKEFQNILLQLEDLIKKRDDDIKDLDNEIIDTVYHVHTLEKVIKEISQSSPRVKGLQKSRNQEVHSSVKKRRSITQDSNRSLQYVDVDDTCVTCNVTSSAHLNRALLRDSLRMKMVITKLENDIKDSQIQYEELNKVFITVNKKYKGVKEVAIKRKLQLIKFQKYKKDCATQT